MASISRDRNGRRNIRFVRSDGTRPKIRLGKVTQKQAEAVKVHVERLVATTITGHVVDDETARWVAALDGVLAGRLAHSKRTVGTLTQNFVHRSTTWQTRINRTVG